MNDTAAMNLIHTAMSGVEWSADTLDLIAQIVESTGREILESDEFENEDS